MHCREGCGACCIALSITSPIPGMPGGKPAGVVCANLDPKSFVCRIWASPDYPPVCRGFHAAAEVCGNGREEALRLIGELERQTR